MSRAQLEQLRQREMLENLRAREAQEAARPEQSGLDYAGDLATEVGQGASLGFADEVAAGIVGGLEWLGGGDFKRGYEGSMRMQERDRKAFQEENPKAALAANLVGGIGTGGVGLTRTAAAQGASRLAKLGNAARNVGIGAAEGALAGYGSADMDQRAEGATGGAVIGGAVPLVGRAISSRIPAFGARQADEVQRLKNARDRMAREAQAIKRGEGKQAEALRKELTDQALPVDLSMKQAADVRRLKGVDKTKALKEHWGKDGAAFQFVKQRDFDISPGNIVGDIDTVIDDVRFDPYRGEINEILARTLPNSGDKVKGDAVMEIRNQLRRKANKGEDMVKRDAFARAAGVVDDVINDGLPDSLKAKYAEELDRFSKYTVLKDATRKTDFRDPTVNQVIAAQKKGRGDAWAAGTTPLQAQSMDAARKEALRLDSLAKGKKNVGELISELNRMRENPGAIAYTLSRITGMPEANVIRLNPVQKMIRGETGWQTDMRKMLSGGMQDAMKLRAARGLTRQAAAGVGQE